MFAGLQDPWNTLGSLELGPEKGGLGRDRPLPGTRGRRSPLCVSRPDKVLTPEESTIAAPEEVPVPWGWGIKGGAQDTLLVGPGNRSA